MTIKLLIAILMNIIFYWHAYSISSAWPYCCNQSWAVYRCVFLIFYSFSWPKHDKTPGMEIQD